MCSANSVKCFHRNKAPLPLIHYEQVLEGFVYIQLPPPPPLFLRFLLFSCHVAVSYLFCGSPSPILSRPPTSKETNAPQPSAIDMCKFAPVCTLSTAYMFLCVIECLRVWCVYIEKEGCYGRLILHILICLFII